MMYGSWDHGDIISPYWDIKCHVQNLLSFWTIFSSFTPLTTQRIKILKTVKNAKTPGDIIILNKCTKNHDHILYCSWDMARDRCHCYFWFWAIFAIFMPLSYSIGYQETLSYKLGNSRKLGLRGGTKLETKAVFTTQSNIYGREFFRKQLRSFSC